MRLLLCVMALIGAFVLQPDYLHAQFRTSFVSKECTATTPTNRIIECGEMSVPLDHDNPAAGKAVLPLMIVRARVENSNAPLYLLQGGPGGDTIDTFSYIIGMPDSVLPDDRDIIFYEQRGTTTATPSLNCTETYDLEMELLDDDISYEEGTNKYIEAMNACMARLRSQNVDFSLFNSRQNALDTIAIAAHFEHDQIDLYGVSYGSILAQHITRMKPALIRSLVIDGIVPPSENVDGRVYESRHNALNAIFTDCENNPACASAYPQLRQTYAQVMADFAANPRIWELTDLNNPDVTHTARIDNNGLQAWIFNWMYDDQLVRYIPLMLYQLANNQVAAVQTFGSFMVFNDSIAEMMYMSTQCSEEASILPTDYVIPADNLMPLQSTERENDYRSREYICAQSQVKPLPEEFNVAFRTEVPLLIVSGRYDPITPAYFGDVIARDNPQATHIVVPNSAHGAMLSNACAASIAKAFWSDPSQSLDTACLNDQRPAFVTPTEIIRSDFVTASAQLQDEVIPAWVVMGITTLLFLVVIFVRVIRLLLNLFRQQAARPSVVRQQLMMQSVVSISGTILMGYLLVQLAILISTNEYSIFFGVIDTNMYLRLGIWGFIGLTAFNVVSALRAFGSRQLRWQSTLMTWVVLVSSLSLTAVLLSNQLY